MKLHTRREFLGVMGSATGAGLLNPFYATAAPPLFFKMSLQQYSFHRSLSEKKLDTLDFVTKARNDFGFSAIEFCNQFFLDKAKDSRFLNELKKRSNDNGLVCVLILCDEEGDLGDLDKVKREKAVENHFKWADFAQALGCEAIRVNCDGRGPMTEVAKASTESLIKLSEYGKSARLNILAENHGGYSSDAKWLRDLVAKVGASNCGTLADFENFDIDPKNNIYYDRYLGVEELMPLAKAVSAKAIDFDENGNCVETDFVRMLTIVKRAGFRGYIGLEYEGNKMSEDDGVRVGKKLLERVGASLG